MITQIEHHSQYEYTTPVKLDNQTLRLIPRGDFHKKIIKHELIIVPEPIQIVENNDLDGNLMKILWFNGETSKLSITSKLIVESEAYNPFQYLIEGQSDLNFPYRYPRGVDYALQRELDPITEISVFKSWLSPIVERSENSIPAFLFNLAAQIQKDFEYKHRLMGVAQTARETFDRRKGSCRDFAVLYMSICRSLNLASRFVSGYHVMPEQSEGELHAWVEVYLPGAGWRGFDPTYGIAVQENYIALSASPYPEHCLPISGVYKGSATSKLETKIRISDALVHTSPTR